MKRSYRTLVLVFTSILLASFALAQVPQFTPFSSDMQITSNSPRGPQDMNGKLYVGNGHMRLNMDAQGHQTAIITDFATKTVDVLMIEPKMYMEHKAGAMSRPGMASNPTEDLKPFDPDNPCANQPDVTCKKIGIETVSGRTCEHWEITNKSGKVVNVWLDRALHFPVKTVSQDATILLTNIKEGEPDASLFKVPADFHQLDMGSMMGPGGGRPPQN